MRQKITVEQLKTTLNDEDVDFAIEEVTRDIKQLQLLPNLWLDFGREKLALATESLEFLLQQKQRIHQQGFPSEEDVYLTLIERQLIELKKVYVAFYELAPGLVYEVQDVSVLVFIWLMLEPEFSQQDKHLLIALSHVENMDEEINKMLFLHSQNNSFDLCLARLIEGGYSLAEFCFNLLRLRQSLSNNIATHWLHNDKLSAEIVHRALSNFNIEKSIEWIEEHATHDHHLFERLLPKQDRNIWFRRHFSIVSELPEVVKTYGILLEIHELMKFDVTASFAPFQLALTGNTSWAEIAIEQLLMSSEIEGGEWMHALHVVYGDKLPFKPELLGVDYQWDEILDVLNDWVGAKLHISSSPLRLGTPLSYESTLKSLRSCKIPARYRNWLWQQLCIHARVYIPWDAYMPRVQQVWIFDKLNAQSLASERFNLRNYHAALGY